MIYFICLQHVNIFSPRHDLNFTPVMIGIKNKSTAPIGYAAILEFKIGPGCWCSPSQIQWSSNSSQQSSNTWQWTCWVLYTHLRSTVSGDPVLPTISPYQVFKKLSDLSIMSHATCLFIYLFIIYYLLTDICYTPFHVDTTKASAVNVI